MPPTADETTKQREAIRQVYNSPSWVKKLNLMRPDQVTAIYLRLKSQKKI